MNITKLAIEKRTVTYTALFIIVIGGLIAFNGLPRAEDPGFVIRTALVLTYFPGASPERVEQLVTDKLEKAIQEIPELDTVVSESRTGVSEVYVNIKERYKEMRPIWDDLRRKIDGAKGDLPEGVIGPFVNDEFGDVFGVVITITGEGFSYAELKDVAEEIRDELLQIDEAAKVDIYGAQEERVFVEFNNARLSELGLSPYQLKEILESSNIIIPGGSVDTGEERIILEPSGNFESIDDLRNTVVNIPGSRELVYLRDIVNIKRGYIDPPESKMKSTGASCLGLSVSMRDGGNIMILGEKVNELMERIKVSYPHGIEFDVVAFQPKQVEKKVDEFVENLMQAIVIVIGVMLLTLGLRTGLVVATLIPMAMLMSFFVMNFFKIGLDQVSLSSLIIALGMLVDNAIVMSESIMVQMQGGKSPVSAAIDSANELKIPLLVSSLTTIAAFLPIYLAKSAVGEYCAPLFKVVTITLLSSWVLALTMTPLLCCYFLNPHTKNTDSRKSFFKRIFNRSNKRAEGKNDFGVGVKPKTEKSADNQYNTKFYNAYRRFLKKLLKNPILTVIVIVIVFFFAMAGFKYIPFLFFPAAENAYFTADLEFPIGTPIEKTEKMISELEKFMEDELTVNRERKEGIVNWGSFIGEGAPRFVLSYSPRMASPGYAFILVNTTSNEIIDEIISKMEGFCKDSFPDLKATIKRLDYGPPVDTPIAIRITGKDPEKLFKIVDSIEAKLEDTSGTKNISNNWGRRIKKLFVEISQPRARRSGVSNQDIAISLQTIMSGFEISQFRRENEVIPITMRSVDADRHDLGKIESLNVYSQSTGLSVPLKQVADIDILWQPSKIIRRDRLRTVTVTSELETGYNAAKINELIVPWLDNESKEWGIGYSYELGGEDEESRKANESIFDQLPIAGLIILLLLVMQFNSIKKTTIVLITIPLGLIGVVIGLLITDSYFGFMTLLGIVSLSGIVVNNAIVLLDRIKIEIEEHKLTPFNAIIESAQRRLRPIILTTITTIGGLIPLWFGGGAMWEPMAIAIIFGLLFATILTLGFVPVLYMLFYKVKD